MGFSMLKLALLRLLRSSALSPPPRSLGEKENTAMGTEVSLNAWPPLPSGISWFTNFEALGFHHESLRSWSS